MDAATREFVRRRAAGRCEYCLIRQEHSSLAHHIEHIIAKQHHGSDDPENLAPACQECNLHKGPNLAGIDQETGEVAMIFNPRSDRWAAHFAFRGMFVVALTPVGRVTIDLLAMNNARRLETREELLSLGESLG